MGKSELKQLISTHFGDGDYHLVLFHDVADITSGTDKGEEDTQELINSLCRLYETKDKSYKILNLSCSPKSGRKVDHILLSGGIGRKEITNIWKSGWSECNRIVSDADKLSDYLETLTGDPETHYSVIYVSEKV